MSKRRTRLWRASVCATAFLIVLSLASSAPSLSGAAVPLAVTALLLAMAAVVAAVALIQPLARLCLAATRPRWDIRSAARQWDPSAAGHVQSRAPAIAVPAVY